jgi:hypothetical protein
MLTFRSLNHRVLVVSPCHTPEEAEACNIVYIGPAEKERTHSLLQRLQEKSLITVGETEEFSRRGGVLGFEEIKKESSTESVELKFWYSLNQCSRLKRANIKLRLDVLQKCGKPVP